ncbi:hypothetical protein [Nocardia wallacei]|uniref:hypothetical protein n=1 Tax=Nocardia wallacei TaxID=480035 RepID=UPI002457D383|nr:hypothetical protein [Nocardia wallacei]
MPEPTLFTVSRSEYEQLTHLGRAGDAPALESSPVTEQWRAEHPDWRGRHWAYTEEDHGVLRLRPLNVARATRPRPAA